MSTPAPPKTSLQIHTQHCRACAHLLLATTRDLASLPRRKSPAADAALILPLEKLQNSEDDEAQLQTPAKSSPKHVTLLLSTTIPDRRATLIRREDGIEKRTLLRCGRCRVVVGYYLDKVHWSEGSTGPGATGEIDDGEEESQERPPAMYVLPGALVQTEKMGGEGIGEEEWRAWAGDA